MKKREMWRKGESEGTDEYRYKYIYNSQGGMKDESKRRMGEKDWRQRERVPGEEKEGKKKELKEKLWEIVYAVWKSLKERRARRNLEEKEEEKGN